MNLLSKRNSVLLSSLVFVFTVLMIFNETNYIYASSGSSLPISGGYSTSASFVTTYKNNKFVFFFSDGIKGEDEEFLVSIDGKDTKVILSTKNQVGVIETGRPQKVVIYRDKERGELSPQFIENYKNYSKSHGGKTYYYYKEIDNMDKALSKKEKTMLSSLDEELFNKINTDKNEEKKKEAIGKLQLLTKEGIVEEHIIYKSDFVNDETQVKNTIEHIYNRQYGVIEIIALNNIPLLKTEFVQYSGIIGRSNLSSSEVIPTSTNESNMGSLNQVDLSSIGPKRELEDNSFVLNGKAFNIKSFTKSGTLMLPSYIFEEAGINVARKYRKDDLDLVTLLGNGYKIEMRIKDNRTFINNFNKYDIAPERIDDVVYLPSHLLHYFGYTFKTRDTQFVIERSEF